MHICCISRPFPGIVHSAIVVILTRCIHNCHPQEFHVRAHGHGHCAEHMVMILVPNGGSKRFLKQLLNNWAVAVEVIVENEVSQVRPAD